MNQIRRFKATRTLAEQDPKFISENFNNENLQHQKNKKAVVEDESYPKSSGVFWWGLSR